MAIAFYSERLDLLRKMDIEAIIANVQYSLADFVHVKGHYQLTKKLYSECIEIFTKQGDEAEVAKCTSSLTSITDMQATASH